MSAARFTDPYSAAAGNRRIIHASYSLVFGALRTHITREESGTQVPRRNAEIAEAESRRTEQHMLNICIRGLPLVDRSMLTVSGLSSHIRPIATDGNREDVAKAPRCIDVAAVATSWFCCSASFS
jgi:hypothetical protein